MLDEVVKVETENQLVGRVLEEGAGEEEVLDLQVVSSATKNTRHTRHTKNTRHTKHTKTNPGPE